MKKIKMKNLKNLIEIMFLIIALMVIVSCKKKDEAKPIITLKGNKEITIDDGGQYKELGVIATDNVDGDISKNVKISFLRDDKVVEKIDVNISGKYLVKYLVEDLSGNVSDEISRIVIINKKIEEKVDNNTTFIKVGTANLRDNMGKSGVKVALLTKGTELKVIKEVKDEAGVEWLNVEYHDKLDKKNAWIKKEFTTKKREELINPKYRNLDYSSYEKKGYPKNPKVKVKGIYLTIYSAGGKKLDSLIEMTKHTEINAFVIDVKDDNGYLLFPMKAGEKFAPKANQKNTIKDINVLMKKLKDNNIYTIARIVSFKDPIYTETYPERAIVYKDTKKPFTNSDNLTWATAYDRQLWEYNISVAKEAIAAGFNEVQFDYVRFPASNGGKLDKILDYRNLKNESKAQVLQEYLKYARKELSPLQAYISADVYGLVSSVEDDMALGQYWEGISNVVDYISPMVYPSHYGNGTYGLSIPDAFPYETVFNSGRDAIRRNNIISTPATIRPWIQDFTASWVKGHIKYGDTQVAEQIRALKENGIDEYLLWNASNRYSEKAVRSVK